MPRSMSGQRPSSTAKTKAGESTHMVVAITRTMTLREIVPLAHHAAMALRAIPATRINALTLAPFTGMRAATRARRSVGPSAPSPPGSHADVTMSQLSRAFAESG